MTLAFHSIQANPGQNMEVRLSCDEGYTTEHVFRLQYRKVPKFSDARKLCCNLPKIQTKRPNHRVFPQKDANGTANSEDPDQTAPLGAV